MQRDEQLAHENTELQESKGMVAGTQTKAPPTIILLVALEDADRWYKKYLKKVASQNTV
jgi:hypothetical protein